MIGNQATGQLLAEEPQSQPVRRKESNAGLPLAREIARLNLPSTSLQRAGDPKGLMKLHTKTKQTYHHIIPENKLHTLWDTMAKHKHFRQLKPGLKSVVARGYSQLDTAIMHNAISVLRSG